MSSPLMLASIEYFHRASSFSHSNWQSIHVFIDEECKR